MPPVLDFGLPGTVIGCAVSCFSCDDVTGVRPGVDAYGRRWVRPSLLAESRDATGERRPISSDTPVLLPRGNTYFELAPCWQQVDDPEDRGGRVFEWFNRTICPCNDACPDEAGCDFLIGFLHTCFAYTGFRWAPEYIICTGQYVGHVPIMLTLATNALGQAAFARTAHRTIIFPSGDTWCTSNFGVQCWGHTESSNCIQPPNWPEYYNEPHHALWDYAHITSFAARFGQDQTDPDDYRAAIDAKNAVMEFIADDISEGFDGLLHLDQIESVRRGASPATNWNLLIDYWSRGWNPRPGDDPEDWVPFADLPAVMEFPNSKLVNTGFPVIAEYVIMGAAIELSMVLHRIKSVPPCHPDPGTSEQNHALYPLVRMRVTVWMGMRVQFPDGAPRYLQQTWRDPPSQVRLSIVNGYDQPFPRITFNGQLHPANSDQVVYIDDSDRRLDPPPHIVWQGHRGFFSDPPTEDRFHHELFDGGERECKSAAAGLEGMIIPAIESHADNDEGDRKRIWTGSLKFVFPWREY